LKIGVWIKIDDFLNSLLASEPMLPLLIGKHILFIAVLIDVVNNVLKCELYLPVM
jgi:hypothetical protein